MNTLFTHTMQNTLHLEIEMQNCTADHRTNTISMSTKQTIFEARRWMVAHSITNFGGTASWHYRFMMRQGVWNNRQLWILKRNVGSVMLLTQSKIMKCLKKVKVWTITIVMMTVLAVKEILWHSATSTNFVLNQYCVE